MNENFELKNCSENDVLEFRSGTYRIKKILDGICNVFKGTLSKQLYESLKNNQIDIYPGHQHRDLMYYKWFTKGIDCEILQLGSESWEKGRLKINISVEFIPDEVEKTESPLDDVRQEIKHS